MLRSREEKIQRKLYKYMNILYNEIREKRYIYTEASEQLHKMYRQTFLQIQMKAAQKEKRKRNVFKEA